MTINDKVYFLKWLSDRIINVYGENKNADFLLKLHDIINDLENFDYEVFSLNQEIEDLHELLDEVEANYD